MASLDIGMLVAGDDHAVRRSLSLSLMDCGFKAREAGLRTVLDALLVEHVQLVLADVTMPGVSPPDLSRSIRAFDPRVGIVMFSRRNSEEDRIACLEAGADDFITQPMALRELVARLRAITRRHQSEARLATPGPLRAGCLELDVTTRVLRKSGVEIHLTPKEFDVTAALMRNLGHPVSHRKLLQTVWGPEYGNETEYLRSYVKMVRKKIEDDPGRPVYIVTEPWAGYRMRNPAEAMP